jgi:hypothetical protein
MCRPDVRGQGVRESHWFVPVIVVRRWSAVEPNTGCRVHQHDDVDPGGGEQNYFKNGYKFALTNATQSIHIINQFTRHYSHNV